MLPFCFLLSCTNPENPRNSIKVSGEGKIRIKPDLVILTIDVSFVQHRMVDAVRQSQQTVNSVVAILSQFGNRQNDIKTSNIIANKEYNYERSRSVFIGFKAEQSIDFVLNDINKFTDLTAKLLTTKINSISQVQFGHSKSDGLLREADLLAYDDALKSADKLCARANVRLGRLLYLTNTGQTDSDPSSIQIWQTSILSTRVMGEKDLRSLRRFWFLGERCYPNIQSPIRSRAFVLHT